MKKKENHETIFRAALRVFARYGYKKATVEDIARELGMSKGNLYLYVKDKEDLYHKTVAHALMVWQGRVAESIAREQDTRRQFIVMCEKAMDHLWQDRDLRQVLALDPEIFPMFPSRDPFAAINRASMNMIRSIMEKGIAEGTMRGVDLEVMPQVVFSIYKMFIIRSYIGAGGRSVKKMFAETLRVLTEGLFIQA